MIKTVLERRSRVRLICTVASAMGWQIDDAGLKPQLSAWLMAGRPGTSWSLEDRRSPCPSSRFPFFSEGSQFGSSFAALGPRNLLRRQRLQAR